MFQINDQQFHELVNESMAQLPKKHLGHLKNVAIVVEDFPSPDQRQKLALRNDQTLLGLYEGVPLSNRQGNTKVLPDKITVFKLPLEARSNSLKELKENIHHTLWHEVAHYFGLDHPAIQALEGNI